MLTGAKGLRVWRRFPRLPVPSSHCLIDRVELIKDAFTIRIQLLSGSDDSIEAMSGRLGMKKSAG
jgi:hypothetical protein